MDLNDLMIVCSNVSNSMEVGNYIICNGVFAKVIEVKKTSYIIKSSLGISNVDKSEYGHSFNSIKITETLLPKIGFEEQKINDYQVLKEQYTKLWLYLSPNNQQVFLAKNVQGFHYLVPSNIGYTPLNMSVIDEMQRYVYSNQNVMLVFQLFETKILPK